MKKTIVITSVALVFAVGSINATAVTENSETLKVEKVVSGVNTFCISIAKGDIETVQKLIELGENVNQKSNGMTPLMYAARYNRCDILQLLIDKGAVLKTKSESGFTALKYAKLSNAEKAVAILEKVLDEKKRKS